jgi:hypothetical protein
MKMQGTEKSEQGTDRIELLLRRTIPPVGEGHEPPHDLWPALQARLSAEPPHPARLPSVPWFDWALAACLALFALLFPAAVPMLLYYL